MNPRQGVLKAFNAGTYLADVQLTGSLHTYLVGVPTSRDIAAGDMVVGRKIAVLFFDDGNPGDAVLAAVFT